MKLNITPMICMLLSFAMSVNSLIAKQIGHQVEAARRMGRYIQDCDCRCGFPAGSFQIKLTSASSGRYLDLKLAINDEIDIITGISDTQAAWVNGPAVPNGEANRKGEVYDGVHDCEHAYFKVKQNGKNNVDTWECKAFGSGCPKIGKMVATCTYHDGQVAGGKDYTEVYFGVLVPY